MPAVTLAFILFWTPFFAWAQSENDAPTTWKAGVFTGPYLPTQLPGVTEVIKTIGARGAASSEGYGLQLTFFRGSEDGAAINYLLGSGIIELDLPSVPTAKVFVGAGLQSLYYHPANTDSTQNEYSRANGFHSLAGINLNLSSGLAARGQFTLLNGPGLCLMVELGFEFPLFGSSFVADDIPENEAKPEGTARLD